jgi:hypothetical protein
MFLLAMNGSGPVSEPPHDTALLLSGLAAEAAGSIRSPAASLLPRSRTQFRQADATDMTPPLRTNKARASAKRPTASAAAQLRSFVAKFTPEHQSLIRATRRWLRKRLPAANELVYDNYNFFVIGYSPTQRPSDAVLSIAASSNGVSLCFVRGKGLPDPHKLLKGAGNQTRSVHLDSVSSLAHHGLVSLIDEAVGRTRAPFMETRGSLTIRAVSAKQRPRQRPSGKRLTPTNVIG